MYARSDSDPTETIGEGDGTKMFRFKTWLTHQLEQQVKEMLNDGRHSGLEAMKLKQQVMTKLAQIR